MASYVIIAKQISWGGDFDFQDYHGEAVASEDGFFLVIRQHEFDALSDFSEGPLGLLGGFVGHGICDLASNFTRKKCLYELNLLDLPAAISQDPTWPVKTEGEGRVIVIPRAAVERLYYSWWGPLKVYTENFVFCLQPRFFLRGRGWVMRTLRSIGWKI